MNKHDSGSKPLKQLLREKYIKHGLEALSENEAIELLLTYSAGKNFKELADNLENKYSSLAALVDADINSLMNQPGLDEKTIVLLRIIPQLSRLYFMESSKISVLDSSKNAVKYFEGFFIGALEEQLAAVCTDEKFKIISSKTLNYGSDSTVNVSCRQLVDFALKSNCSRIFIAHNHPTGSAIPSASDYNVTDLVRRTLERLGIFLIDHIIIGKHSSVSMRELPYTMPFNGSELCGYTVSAHIDIN